MWRRFPLRPRDGGSSFFSNEHCLSARRKQLCSHGPMIARRSAATLNVGRLA